MLISKTFLFWVGFIFFPSVVSGDDEKFLSRRALLSARGTTDVVEIQRRLFDAERDLALCLTEDRDLAAGPPWYETETEYAFMEAFVLMLLVMVVLIFEKLEHFIEHWLEEDHHHKTTTDETDILAHVHLAHHHNQKGPKYLPKEKFFPLLFGKMKDELSVMGFTALLIWIVRTGGAFDYKLDDRTFGLSPKDGYDMLHLVEDVHVHLFVAMVLYFFCVAWLVNILVMHFLEPMEGFECWFLKLETELRQMPEKDRGMYLRSKISEERDAEMTQNNTWMKYLFEPSYIATAGGYLDFKAYVVATVAKYFAHVHIVTFNSTHLEEYMARTINKQVQAISEFSVQCWMGVLSVAAIYMAFCAVGVNPVWVTGGLVCCFFGVLAYIYKYVVCNMQPVIRRTHGSVASMLGECETSVALSHNRRRQSLARMVEEGNVEIVVPHAHAIHERVNTELILGKAVQVFLLLLCFCTARMVCSPRLYKGAEYGGILQSEEMNIMWLSLFLTGILALIVLVVPVIVTRGWLLMAVPPYFAPGNQSMFIEVLDDYPDGYEASEASQFLTPAASRSLKMLRAEQGSHSLGLKRGEHHSDDEHEFELKSPTDWEDKENSTKCKSTSPVAGSQNLMRKAIYGDVHIPEEGAQKNNNETTAGQPNQGNSNTNSTTSTSEIGNSARMQRPEQGYSYVPRNNTSESILEMDSITPVVTSTDNRQEEITESEALRRKEKEVRNEHIQTPSEHRGTRQLSFNIRPAPPLQPVGIMNLSRTVSLKKV